MVRRIDVRIFTSHRRGADTDGAVYLGIGGREFHLDITGHDDFQQGNDLTYQLGEDANIADAERNDPREHFALSLGELGQFPVYIRFLPDSSRDDWNLAGVDVTAWGADEARYFTALGNGHHLWLGNKSGLFCYLRGVAQLPDRTFELGA